MDGRRRQRSNGDDPVARQRDLCDIELDDLRRQVQQLEQCLVHSEPLEHDVEGHDSEANYANKGMSFNPFHDNGNDDTKDDEEPYEAALIYDEYDEEGHVVPSQVQLLLHKSQDVLVSELWFSTTGHRRQRPNGDDHVARQRDLRDIELDDLRRQEMAFNPFHDNGNDDTSNNGHFTVDCPNRRIITIVEEEDYKEPYEATPIYDEYDEEGYVVPSQVQPLLQKFQDVVPKEIPQTPSNAKYPTLHSLISFADGNQCDKIYSSTHEICQLVTSALPSPVDSMAVKCIKELQCTDEKQISIVIEKAIRDQSDNGSSSSEYLDMISNSLSLLSNEELLIEVVTLKKLKVKFACSNTLIEIEDIDGIIAIVTYMHDCYTKTHQVHSINGVSVPADFCCPLSLDLMSDPVIVASGQTYERAFIRKWLDQGPRTHQTLGHSNLIPNYTVKALIANWCKSNDIKLPDPLNLTRSNLPSFLNLTDVSTKDLIVYHASHAINTNIPRAPESYGKANSHKDAHSSNGKPGVSLATTETNEFTVELRNARSGSQIVRKSEQDLTDDSLEQPRDANLVSWVSSDLTHYSSDASGELAQDSQASSASQREPKFPLGFVEARSRSQNMWKQSSVPHIHSSQSLDSRSDLSGVESEILKLIEGLKSDSVDIQRNATGELRLLARHNMDNRIVIANCGAISLLVGLLYSTNPQSPDPRECCNAEAKENAAATWCSLSVIEENKVRIGRSGAIAPLVELLANGTPRGKKDAATALFNLSIFHENKARIVQAGAVRYLVELMDPAAGMVDKAVAVLSNLATTPEGKENAASALLHLCTNSSRYCSIVLQEGAIEDYRKVVDHGHTLRSEVAGHLDVLLSETALLVEGPQIRRVIENDLVATGSLGVIPKEPDHPLPQVPAAEGGIDDDVLDVADLPSTAEELPLHEDATGGDYSSAGSVLRDDDEVVVTEGGEFGEASAEISVRERRSGGAELGEKIHEALGVIGDLKTAERGDKIVFLAIALHRSLVHFAGLRREETLRRTATNQSGVSSR
ncbi:hypothetical protein ZIOFF_021355 [Zingiber officinale]|uniref:RING-type E3 ubiquitin transferase n=1 Tax=Zingiber officinale TaxID=94328 RepID=A0A8J5LGZ9_ZINOF|nr:hypothetical protein ZIOFF_021355 [Zingiber officinale]